MGSAVQILNKLLTAECASLASGLTDAQTFTSWAAAEDRALVQRMIADEADHRREIAEMILRLGGAPDPPTPPIEVGGLHFLELSHLMFAILASKRQLVETYQSTGATGDDAAEALIRRLSADHARHLADLERLNVHLAAPQ